MKTNNDELRNCADDYRYLLNITENKDNLHGWLRIRVARIEKVLSAAQQPAPEAAKPEQQAQGEPEVVMTYHGRCMIDCGEHGHHDVELHKLIAKGTQLITLQSHREAMAAKDALLFQMQNASIDMAQQLDKKDAAIAAESDRVLKLVNRLAAAAAKKDAALQACVGEPDKVQRVLNRLNSSDPDFQDCADAAELISSLSSSLSGCVTAMEGPHASLLIWAHAMRDAITQAQEALK